MMLNMNLWTHPSAGVLAKFWFQVEKQEGDGCWLWTGSCCPKGYGRFNYLSAAITAHRFAWAAMNGPVTGGLFVCHHCDVRNCVRPDHLFLGTHRDNMDDQRAKGRTLKGEDHGNHKHSADVAREVAQRVVVNGETHKAVALALGIPTPTVAAIACGRMWSSVTGLPRVTRATSKRIGRNQSGMPR